ncbi:MAG: thiamine pyrophosphate-binding protein [Rhodospirillales bacterium]
MPKTSQALVQTMIDAGVTRAFTLPGLGITWSLDAFHEQRDKLDVVLTRTEQIASVMAQVTGRLTGKPGVFMGQGPFASTIGGFGILEAYFSGSPMVILTEASDYDGFGQYGVYQTMTGDYGGADIQSMLRGMTKYSTFATEPQDAVYGLQMAFKHATLPRSGPAAVIMKSGIVRRDVPESPRARLYPIGGYLAYTPAKVDGDAIERLARLINKAERPAFIAGNGVLAANAGKTLQDIASKIGAMVATSYNAKGCVDETIDCAVGMLGTWGCATANRAVASADLIVMVGVSMGPDYTRFRDPKMIRPGDQTLVQIDVDPRNAGWVYPVDLAITADAADALDVLASQKLDDGKRDKRLGNIKTIKKDTSYDSLPDLPAAQGYVHHVDVVRALQKFLTKDDYLTLDAGANRIWTTNGLRVKYPGRLVVPGGIGGMGWSPPAAAAIKLLYPDQRVTSLAGDGGFSTSLQVLATCVEQSLSVVFMVSNNQGLGMVRDNLGKNRIAVDFSNVDFAKVAEGFGCRGMTVTHPDQILGALEDAHRAGGPVVINVCVDPEASHHPAMDP